MLYRKRFFIIIFLISIFLFTMHYINNGIQLDNIGRGMNVNTPLKALDNPVLPIGIFYDGRYSEPWNFNAQKVTEYLNQTLREYNLIVFVLNATELRIFMETNPVGIIIITMGVAPSTIWNGSENSFVEAWLDNGGIIIWTGCIEFYWIGYESGENVPIGEIGSTYVLDMEYLVTILNQYMIPTQLGNDLFINISSHTTDVFSSISALNTANVYFEIYAKKGDFTDPVLFQPKDGKGYFVRIHANYDDQLSVYNLSTWISSFIYNRFFKLPVITATNSISSIFFLTSGQLFINITNFSEYFDYLYINSTSDGFLPINTSLMISPIERKSLNFTITPRTLARLKQYELQLNLFSNYTDSQNKSKILLIFSKMIYILIQTPISFEIIDIAKEMYPGSTYSLLCNIQKYINESVSIDIILICEGCINELKTNVNLNQNNTIIEIIFSVQLMAKPGSYEMFIRIYQDEILFSSSTVSIQIQSIFQNPIFLLLIFLLSSIIITLLSLYLYNRKKEKGIDQEIIAILESKNIIFLKNISKTLNIEMNKILKRIESCFKRKSIAGYLVRNEKKEFFYVKKIELQNFVLDIISRLKTSDIYEIAKILNLDPLELEIILRNKINKSKSY